MEFLVTMTTHVPDGTPAETVDEVRAREAAHSRELATQGHLLRLWRPPLQPGEWRTLGLFAADDEYQLEEVLASMPLRIWRSDEVTALATHPNDPVAHGPGRAPEFLTMLTITIPPSTPTDVVDDTMSREARALVNWPGRGISTGSGCCRPNRANYVGWGFGAPRTPRR